MPQEALDVVRAWGFTLKTMQGFTWHKRSRTGKTAHWGMGHWTRANAECCLFAVRGRPKRVCAAVRSLIGAPIGAHSEKPPEARERLVALLGDVPRIELFARQVALGWDVVGNGIDGRDRREMLPPTP